MAQATIELGGLTRQISTIVGEACRTLANSIAEHCKPRRDISGIRQIIIGNANIVWPMLHPHSSRDAPNFNVIVFGVVPTVRAEVIYEDASLSNIIFMRGPTETSAELAIQGLLDTSMVALDQQYNANVFRDPTERWNAARLENGRGSGWYSGQ